jgi:hypothetical protein
MLWSKSRKFYPAGADESVDGALAELRKSLDSLKAVLNGEQVELDLDENDELHLAGAQPGEKTMEAAENLEEPAEPDTESTEGPPRRRVTVLDVSRCSILILLQVHAFGRESSERRL